MHSAPNAVTDVVPNHRIAVGFRVLLNCPTDIPQMLPWPALLDCTLETLFGDAN
jgi:hypothetical protein